MKDQSSMFADFLNSSLQEIDYREIAESHTRDIPLYSAGWNMPGYTPDNTPAVFTDFSSARDYILESLENYFDANMDNPDFRENQVSYDDSYAAIKREKGAFSIAFGDYIHWVSEE